MSATWKRQMIARVRSGDPEALALVPHGTLNGYNGYGCQCEACSKAMSDYCKDRRRRLGITKGTMPTPEQREAAIEAYQRRGLTSAAKESGFSKGTILLWFKDAEADVLERIAKLVEEDQRQNGRDGIHCPVDGTPMPGNRQTTCSSRCAQLWAACRYQVDETYKADHKARIALWNIEHTDDPIQLRHARRVIKGEPLEERGVWLNSEDQLARLEEVMERRAAAKAKWGDLAADLPPIRALERGIARVGA